MSVGKFVRKAGTVANWTPMREVGTLEDFMAGIKTSRGGILGLKSQCRIVLPCTEGDKMKLLIVRAILCQMTKATASWAADLGWTWGRVWTPKWWTWTVERWTPGGRTSATLGEITWLVGTWWPPGWNVGTHRGFNRSWNGNYFGGRRSLVLNK